MHVIETAKDNILAIRIDGKIETKDMESFLREAETRMSRHEKLRVYVEFEKFPTISLQALWEDLKFVLPNFKRFEAKAVVADMEWAEKLTEFVDRLFPSIHLRLFDKDEGEKAMNWLLQEDLDD